MTDRFTRVDDGRVVYRDPWMAVKEYAVERGGVGATYSVVERSDSVIVIPITPAGTTVLLKQFRFPTNESAWELPMGGVQGSETPGAAARRELAEEVGLRAGELVQIGEYRPAPGLTRQTTTVFVVPVSDAELVERAGSWSASEEIQDIAVVSLADVPAMIADGRVTDGFSLTGFLLLRLWLNERAPIEDHAANR